MFIDFGERGGGWRKRREGERETERETLMWEGNIDWLPPICTSTGDQTHNLGMCPDWGSDLQPFGVWDHAPTNSATSQGKMFLFFKVAEEFHSM